MKQPCLFILFRDSFAGMRYNAIDDYTNYPNRPRREVWRACSLPRNPR